MRLNGAYTWNATMVWDCATTAEVIQEKLGEMDGPVDEREYIADVLGAIIDRVAKDGTDALDLAKIYKWEVSR